MERKLLKNRGFTLIELLVVVAIIGILAAVGVTTFSGFQEKAKISATKANHKMIIKYIMTETKKCDLGETAAMDGNLICSNLNVATPVPVVLIAAEKALKDKFKNPFNSSLPAICSAPTNTCNVYSYHSKGSAGVVNLREHGPKTMEVGTCFSESCTYKDKDYLESGYIAIID